MTDEGVVLTGKISLKFFCPTPFSSGEGEKMHCEGRVSTVIPEEISDCFMQRTLRKWGEWDQAAAANPKVCMKA